MHANLRAVTPPATSDATTPQFSFSAGPAALPAPVRERIRDEFGDFAGTGRPVLELPFSGPEFRDVMARAERDLRTLLTVPDDHAVLFLQGGASAQFGLLPQNLGTGPAGADYVDTGYWSRKTIAEAARVTHVGVAATGADHIPDATTWRVRPDAAYLHVTTNETADGLAFHDTPVHPSHVPLVADMSSDFLTRPIDVADWGVIYASAQKNIGPAGLTVVLVRRDLLGRAHRSVPAVFDYTRQDEAGSRFNTPPTFAIYVAGLVLEWLLSHGGVAAMALANRRKSAAVYDAIDDSDGFYRCGIRADCRSHVNVCFRIADEALTDRFVASAREEGLLDLAGHSRVGGLRASLYNAVPEAAATALAAFMRGFQRRHG
jgi:phosphoserine aminotransferase